MPTFVTGSVKFQPPAKVSSAWVVIQYVVPTVNTMLMLDVAVTIDGPPGTVTVIDSRTPPGAPATSLSSRTLMSVEPSK